MSVDSEGPRLVLFMGCAGSGKTTLARQVLKRQPMTYLNKDTVWQALLAWAESREKYLAQRDRWYRVLYSVVEDNLTLGTDVLLDAPHIRQMQDPAWRLELQRLVDRAGADLRCVHCHCSEMILLKRLRDRGLERDNWKLANWKVFSHVEPIVVPIPFSHIMVDTGNPVLECVDRVIGYLNVQGTGV